MSGRLPAVKPRQLIQALERKGWSVERIAGSHHILVQPELQRVVSVPLHNRELKTGTLIGILRVAEIRRDELVRLLK